jgi:hypothetical protein
VLRTILHTVVLCVNSTVITSVRREKFVCCDPAWDRAHYLEFPTHSSSIIVTGNVIVYNSWHWIFFGVALPNCELGMLQSGIKVFCKCW